MIQLTEEIWLVCAVIGIGAMAYAMFKIMQNNS